MAESNDPIAGAQLLAAMWSYAASVLEPTRALKRSGVPVFNAVIGDEPLPIAQPALGPYFSLKNPKPVYLDHPTDHDHLVEEFDRIAEVYAELVEPFSGPIFEEALARIAPILPPDARVLDAGCGPGRELVRMARLVPQGEVVGVDLAAGMVTGAYRAARAAGLDNCAFFQADIAELPAEFEGRFDLAYNCLAHHHYPQPAAAAKAILRCLRPGGLYCVVDPGPAWYNRIGDPLARRGDPGFVGFHTPEEFRALFASAGFSRTCWIELLPGFGVAIGQKGPASTPPSRKRPARNGTRNGRHR